MSEPGIPSKTALASETPEASQAERLKRLLGPGFDVVVKYEEWNLAQQYQVSACKDGHYINWTMVADDFNYNDHDLIIKFINPATECFNNAKQP